MVNWFQPMATQFLLKPSIGKSAHSPCALQPGGAGRAADDDAEERVGALRVGRVRDADEHGGVGGLRVRDRREQPALLIRVVLDARVEDAGRARRGPERVDGDGRERHARRLVLDAVVVVDVDEDLVEADRAHRVGRDGEGAGADLGRVLLRQEVLQRARAMGRAGHRSRRRPLVASWVPPMCRCAGASKFLRSSHRWFRGDEWFGRQLARKLSVWSFPLEPTARNSPRNLKPVGSTPK